MSDKKIEPDPKRASQEPLGDDALEQVAGGLGDTGTHEVGHFAPKKKLRINAEDDWEPGAPK